MAGEGITHLDSGRPMVIRMPGSKFTLANFFRSQLYSTIATQRLGMEILKIENVALNNRVFADTESSVMTPDETEIAGFNSYMEQYEAMLEVKKSAVDNML